MRNRRNFYRILGVQSDAPVEVVKASYRTIMHRLKMHPDLGGDHEQAALINEAFATLSNPLKRAEYDRRLGPVEDEREPQPPATSSSPSLRPAVTHPAVAAWTAAPASQPPICGFCHAPCSRHSSSGLRASVPPAGALCFTQRNIGTATTLAARSGVCRGTCPSPSGCRPRDRCTVPASPTISRSMGCVSSRRRKSRSTRTSESNVISAAPSRSSEASGPTQLRDGTVVWSF